MFSIPPPPSGKSCRLQCWKKNGWTRSAAEGNIIRRMRLACQKTNPRVHTLKICNNYCVSTATMVARTPLIVTLYVHCLSRVFASVWKAHACIHTTPRCNVKIKVQWSRYRPGVAQRVGRGITLLFHVRGTRSGWVVSSTPRPHFTPGEDQVPILHEAGWAPGPVWTGGKSRSHRDSIPDSPARSQSLYRLSYSAHTL
jgi:hypothetical protein